MASAKKSQIKVTLAGNISPSELLREFPRAKTVLKPEDIVRARDIVKEVYMDEKIQKYIVDIVFATREPKEAGLEKYVEMMRR